MNEFMAQLSPNALAPFTVGLRIEYLVRVSSGIALVTVGASRIIPELTRTKYSIRSPTVKGARALGDRVRKCLESGALSSGCTVEHIREGSQPNRQTFDFPPALLYTRWKEHLTPGTSVVHGAILEAPTVTNAIPELTRTKYSIRSPTVKGARALGVAWRCCCRP
jgi:metal-dependent amidase/aminoacylase/carboxypeptidase family protein